ncbi:MAG: TetR/AcrR family transcriptional regulator [Dongiaceae bacterium]
MAQRPGAKRAGGTARTGGRSRSAPSSSTAKTANAKAANANTTRPKSARPKSARAAAGTGTRHEESTQDVRKRLHEALLSQVAAIGWRDLSYAQVVKAAGVSLPAAYRLYRSKSGVLAGLSSEIDQRLLGGLEEDPLDGTARDKLFDLIMRRLDLQEANKAAIEGLLHDLPRSPAEALCVVGRLNRSIGLMLELAGVSVSGIGGLMRIKALTGLYLHVLRSWLRDDTADSATTMALLDKRLDQIERLLGLLKYRDRQSK